MQTIELSTDKDLSTWHWYHDNILSSKEQEGIINNMLAMSSELTQAK